MEPAFVHPHEYDSTSIRPLLVVERFPFDVTDLRKNV